MKNAFTVLTEAQRRQIAGRVASLEQRTRAEVVCAVATESGRYDRAESLWGIVAAAAFLITGHVLVGGPIGGASDAGDGAGWSVAVAADGGRGGLGIGWQVLLMTVGFVFGSVVAGFWHPLRWLSVGEQEMEREVHRAACQVYQDAGIGATRSGVGLLLYLSLFERRLEIRADRAVAGGLGDDDLAAIRDAVLGAVRREGVAAGLLAGLEAAELPLVGLLPADATAGGEDSPTAAETEEGPGGVDELCDEVLLFHPRP